MSPRLASGLLAAVLLGAGLERWRRWHADQGLRLFVAGRSYAWVPFGAGEWGWHEVSNGEASLIERG